MTILSMNPACRCSSSPRDGAAFLAGKRRRSATAQVERRFESCWLSGERRAGRVRARSTAKDGRSQGAEAGQVDSGSSGRLSGSRRSSAQARRSAPALARSCALRFCRLRRSAAANRARRSGPAARGEPPSRPCRCESSIGARVPATVGCVNQPCQVPRRRGIVESNSGRQRRFESSHPPISCRCPGCARRCLDVRKCRPVRSA